MRASPKPWLRACFHAKILIWSRWGENDSLWGCWQMTRVQQQQRLAKKASCIAFGSASGSGGGGMFSESISSCCYGCFPNKRRGGGGGGNSEPHLDPLHLSFIHMLWNSFPRQHMSWNTHGLKTHSGVEWVSHFNDLKSLFFDARPIDKAAALHGLEDDGKGSCEFGQKAKKARWWWAKLFCLSNWGAIYNSFSQDHHEIGHSLIRSSKMSSAEWRRSLAAAVANNN